MKTIRIIQIILLLIVIALLISLLVVSISGKIKTPFFSFAGRSFAGNTVQVYDVEFDGADMSDASIDLGSADIEFIYSDDQQIRVTYYGPEDEIDSPNIATTYEDNSLRIVQESRVRFFQLFNDERVIVYLPFGYSNDLRTKVSSGNVEFKIDLELSSLLLELSSGNLTLNNVTSPGLEIKVSSGRINADAVMADKYNIKLSSGDINIADIAGEGDIISTSGNMTVGRYEGGGSIKSTSGNIKVGVDKLIDDLYIKLTSGNATVRLLQENPDVECDFDVISGNIRTNFGSVDNEIAGASFRYSFTDDASHKLTVSTTSGNIRAEANVD